MSNCKSCAFFGGKVEGKCVAFYQCLHPMLLQLTGGRLDSVKSSCVLYERKRKKEAK